MIEDGTKTFRIVDDTDGDKDTKATRGAATDSI